MSVTVHIKLNGVVETWAVPFEEDLPVDWVKEEVRTTFGVVNGTLSSRENEIIPWCHQVKIMTKKQ